MDSDQEYTLKELIYPVLKGWRLLLILMIVFGLVSGAFAFVSNKRVTFTEEQISQQQKTLSEKNTEVKDLLAKIENDRKALAAKETYLKQSILLNIDPAAQAEATADVSIELVTGSPMSEQQTQLLVTALTEKYLQTRNQEDLNKYVNSKISANYAANYLNEIISIASGNPGQLTIKAVFTDTGTASNIAAAVVDYWRAYGNANLQISMPHELIVPEIKTAVSANPKITQARDAQQAAISDLQASMDKNQTTIDGIVLAELSKGAYKSIPMYLIIGVILALMLGVFILFLKAYADPYVRDEQSVQKRLGLFVLGTVRSTREKSDRRTTIGKGVDRLVDQYFGDEVVPFTRKESLRYIYASILNVSAYAGAQEPANSGKILCLSFSSPDAASQVMAEIMDQARQDGLHHQLDLTVGGDLLASPEAMLMLHDSKAVVLVEKIRQAKVSRITKGLTVLKQMGKKVAGIVLVE